MIGTFGDIVFEASTQRIRTFDEYERQGEGRWAEHEVFGAKPRSQFLGAGLETITFIMRFYHTFGVDIESELERLRQWRDEGRVERFILGGRPQGFKNARWSILKLEEEVKFWDNNGMLLGVEATVTLKEYY